ncbi:MULTISPECIES: hypothetical protein [unclassified Klebsiella]|uniref:hypothetical protein n=1 Tax=unclassified Klebsiella TaxID=2608929 RepID=UPI000C2A60DF|nr:MULTISPECIES: hypothetical protein [unclassified Klebsiella]PJX60167.1 hypothetical protein CWM63_05710 [Klebsiella sp. F-Nf9]PKJ69235.1 hypothetical protein CW267_18035 [Klebsiella sp. X1-16S-Nf21]
MTKSTITRERLAKIQSWRETYGAGSNVMLPAEEAEELARMALAAMDSEPVAEVLSNRPGNDTSTIDRALPVGTQLYRHAQQPVVPEEATSDSIEILASARRRDHAVFQWGEDQRNAAADSWNACRATMLQAFPVCTCPSGDGSLRWPCPVHPGNSPVIPDGYVMVPKEPTQAMCAAFNDSDYGRKSLRERYVAMLAAAPQEPKS